MAKTLFVSDMDGTLLNNEACVSAESARILTELADRGVLFTVATARTPATIEPLLADTRTTLPAIVMTGAALWHRDTQSYSDVHFLDGIFESDVDRVFESHGIHPFVYTLPQNGIIEVYHKGAELTRNEDLFVSQRLDLPLKHFNIGQGAPAQTAGRRMLHFAMGSIPAIERAADELRRRAHCELSCYRDTYTPNLGLLEVFAPGVSKATAVRKLKESVGADRLVVYGDNLNDLPMLRAADLAVAVDNAVGPVRLAADVIIGPNTADSVARSVASLTANSTL